MSARGQLHAVFAVVYALFANATDDERMSILWAAAAVISLSLMSLVEWAESKR